MSSVDDQIRSALERVLVSLTGQLEADLDASASDILRALSAAQIRTAAEAGERAAAAAREDAQQQLAIVQEAFDRQRDQLQSGAVAEIASLQQTLDEVRERLDAAERDLQEGRQHRDAVEAELAQSRDEADAVRRAADELHLEVESAKSELEEARRLIAEREHDAERARGEIDDARRELESVRIDLGRAERLAAGLRWLNAATSLGDVFDRLTRLVREETDRAAIFLVNTDRLKAWRALGFEGTEPIVGNDLDLGDAGVIGEAVRTGLRHAYPNGNGSTLPAFASGNQTRHALAVPVEVSGLVVAVLYADTPEADSPHGPRWPEIVEDMARHAGRVLEAITVRHAASIRTPGSSAVREGRVRVPGQGVG